MENKKQLIIIPPMSEALKKLNEVLEGISEDENVEISMIDDLKELSQFIATTGQCLILASNAKKCATFLQDNRIMLAKSHCKTILFTPKEIPAKTLIKFTKIGLTESILENSPPKTFLYKVKLLLRSIKTAKPQEDAEKLVKSLEAGKTQGEEATEREIKEKLSAEENVIDMDSSKKKKNDESGETIDYGNPLKGKIKPQEEVIDTNWKSDRKKHTENLNTEEENMAAESELASIDMYYRGKRTKLDNLLGPIEDDFGKLKKSDMPEEEASERKKRSYADVIDDGSMKQKKLDFSEEENEADEKTSSAELDLIAASKKAARKNNDEDDGLDLSMNRRRLDEPAAEEGKTKDVEVEDLGGYLKGKISKQLGEDLAPELEAETEYDNSELDEEESPKDFDLDLLPADKKARKKDNEESIDENTHDGEVDKIDGNMIGDAGTVDKIRTRMNSASDPSAMPEENPGSDLSYSGKRKRDEASQKDDNNDDDSLDLEAQKARDKEKLDKKEEDEELELREARTNLNLLPGDKERNKDDQDQSSDNEHQRSGQLEKLQSEKERRASTTNEDDEDSGLRSRENSGIKEKKDRNQTHDGQVEKIDTFYRSGESKKTDQNWDNLTDKKTSLELLPGKAKNNDGSSAADARKDLGETTIDYRKLKEEFDMIAAGEAVGNSGTYKTAGDTTLRNSDDDGSFKVVEIDPKSLDFSIAVMNSIYNKDLKAKQIFALITEELMSNYHCSPVFYTYKLSDKKFTEVFNSFVEVNGNKMPAEKKEWWNEFKKDTALFEHYQTKSMTTWRCPEIVNNNEVWEDVELPTWAEQELTNKQVELIFPYFDGIDRMGLALVFFPEGLNPKTANGLLTVLEMARTLFLDTIQRYQVVPVKEKEVEAIETPAEEKKNVLSFFGGLFGKRKAG